MLSQQDMEDFMEIEAEQDEVAATLGQPSSADRSTIKEHQAPDPLSMHRDDLTEAMRSLLSAGHQVSELLAQVAKRSRN